MIGLHSGSSEVYRSRNAKISAIDRTREAHQQWRGICAYPPEHISAGATAWIPSPGTCISSFAFKPLRDGQLAAEMLEKGIFSILIRDISDGVTLSTRFLGGSSHFLLADFSIRFITQLLNVWLMVTNNGSQWSRVRSLMIPIGSFLYHSCVLIIPDNSNAMKKNFKSVTWNFEENYIKIFTVTDRFIDTSCVAGSRNPHSTEIFRKYCKNSPWKYCKIVKIFRNLSLILLKYCNDLAMSAQNMTYAIFSKYCQNLKMHKQYFFK